MEKRAASARKRSKTTAAESANYLYLPDDYWEYIFKFLIDDGEGDNNDYLNSISAVCKQFLSITNRIQSSLTIHDPTIPFLSNLFHRFTNLTSLDFTHFHGDLDTLLSQIPPLNNLTSLNLSHKPTIPSIGLRAFSINITTLTSLTCSYLLSFTSNHLFLIADCFPLLQQLILDHVIFTDHDNDTKFLDGIQAISLSLTKLRKLDLSSHSYVTDKCIFHLFRNCMFLEELIITDCFRLTAPAFEGEFILNLKTLCLPGYIITPQIIDSLASLKSLTCIDLSFKSISDELLSYIGIAGLPLRRIDLPHCTGYTYAGIFSLLSKCQSIQHLDFEYSTVLNDRRVVKLSSFLVSLVSVNLSYCTKVTYSSLFALVKKCPSLSEIKMEHIRRKTVNNYDHLTDLGVYPQLKSLNLDSCGNLSDQRICQVLSRCRKISHLSLWACSIENLLELNFEVPNLKMLNLSFTRVKDEALYAISKSCCGLLQLLLRDCNKCTDMGVKYVLENCTQLKEIDLRGCRNVHTDVASMLFLRPSLRKITAPPDCRFSESESKLFLLQGCIVC